MKQRIRILECIRQGQIGGGESHLLSLVEHLDRQIFDPVVLSFTEGPMVDRLQSLDIPVHIIKTLRPFDITKWRKVRTLLKNEKIRLVHAHGSRAGSNLIWAARSLNIPVVYTIHGWSFHPDQKQYIQKIRTLGEKYLVNKSNINISVSASNQQSGKDRIPGFDSIVINNGIDLKKFSPLSVSGNKIREDFGIPKEKILVLFLARFTGHKQPLTLIKAFADAIKNNGQLHLLMVGDGDQKEVAEHLISEFGLQNSITLSPFRQDVPEVLAAADIFVLPSLWEGLPIGLLEAMAMHKAVIATNVDGTKEILIHKQNGLLVEAGDIGGLTSAITDLAGDAELRKTLGFNAGETITDQYDASIMTRKIEEIYISLARRA